VLDAPSPSAKPINASSSSGQGWRRWEPNEARLVDEFCGPLMAKFGYGSEPEWRSLLVG